MLSTNNIQMSLPVWPMNWQAPELNNWRGMQNAFLQTRVCLFGRSSASFHKFSCLLSKLVHYYWTCSLTQLAEKPRIVKATKLTECIILPFLTNEENELGKVARSSWNCSFSKDSQRFNDPTKHIFKKDWTYLTHF